VHDAFEFVLVHLAMANVNAYVRPVGKLVVEQLVQAVGDGIDALNAVVQEEDLAATGDLALDDLADEALVKRDNVSLDRQAVDGRRLDDAHVARTGQGHVERARDRRGAEREHVHELAELLELLLVQHPEPLFLVDHDKTEVLERHIGAEQPVGADDDVHGAFADELDDLLLFTRRAEPAEHLDGDRVTGHAFAEHVPVLFREHGGRAEHGNLHAVHHRLERRADGDLGFAEADIAADEPVHWPVGFHVSFNLLDRGQLIRRFLKREGGLELPLPRRVGSKAVAR